MQTWAETEAPVRKARDSEIHYPPPLWTEMSLNLKFEWKEPHKGTQLAPHIAIAFHCPFHWVTLGNLSTGLIANFSWLLCMQVLENQRENPDEGEMHHLT